jgi:glycosyltransferase involved in cell wall biosynthesis
MMLRFADAVLVNSEAVAEQVRLHRAAAPGRIVMIRNGVDLARFSPAPDFNTRHMGSVTIGTLANLRPEKGIGDLVRAAALVRDRFPEARFVMWGEGLLRLDLERLVRRLELDGVVELRGRTTQPETALREFDIFVLPSLSEASSNALLEAMAAGLPVVATRVGGTPAIVEDQKTGLLVPPGDPAALARAICLLLENPDLAFSFGQAARQRVAERFSLKQMVQHTEYLYLALLQNIRGGRLHVPHGATIGGNPWNL